MKDAKNEPVFLLEMPHTLRHLIMKRGHLLRSGRTRTLMCVGKSEAKSWLEAKLLPAAADDSKESWDSAHVLAERFKRELHNDIYVEPAGLHGRFRDMTAPPEDNAFGGLEDFMSPGETPDMGFGMGVNMGRSMMPGHGSHDPFGMMGFSAGRASNNGMFGFDSSGMGMPNIPGIPHIPDPMKDILPPQVRQAMGMDKGESSKKKKKAPLNFPAFAILPNWAELPESKRRMFEVEAAQLQNEEKSLSILEPSISLPEHAGRGEMDRTPADDQRTLAALSVNPRISAALKRFLLAAFEIIL